MCERNAKSGYDVIYMHSFNDQKECWEAKYIYSDIWIHTCDILIKFCVIFNALHYFFKS